jgi:hypothetical protein
MSTVVQFTGKLNPGASGSWYTFGYPRNSFVNWSARPLTPNSTILITAVSVQQAADGTLTYFLAMGNEGPQPVTFEMVKQTNPY